MLKYHPSSGIYPIMKLLKLKWSNFYLKLQGHISTSLFILIKISKHHGPNITEEFTLNWDLVQANIHFQWMHLANLQFVFHLSRKTWIIHLLWCAPMLLYSCQRQQYQLKALLLISQLATKSWASSCSLQLLNTGGKTLPMTLLWPRMRNCFG